MSPGPSNLVSVILMILLRRSSPNLPVANSRRQDKWTSDPKPLSLSPFIDKSDVLGKLFIHVNLKTKCSDPTQEANTSLYKNIHNIIA